MALSINFDKAKAEYYLDCLANGKPIQPQDPMGWTGQEMLALAGACFFGAQSHGPALYQDTDWSKVPGERREAIEETFDEDLHAAIGWYGTVTMMVADKKYDAHFEPNHRAIVQIEAGKTKIIPINGFRDATS